MSDLEKSLRKIAKAQPELESHVEAILQGMPKKPVRSSRMHAVNIVRAIRNMIGLKWRDLGFTTKPSDFRNFRKGEGFASIEFDHEFEELRLTVERIRIREQ